MTNVVNGLSPLNSGAENHRILQDAVDRGGDIFVSEPGIYHVAGTICIGDHTHITFAPGVYLVRESDPDGDTNFIINSNAYKREYNTDISITGLHLSVNGVERSEEDPKGVLGLRAHIAFMYIRDLVLRDITVLELLKTDYGIQISDFENVTVERIRVEGMKDGIHFGPGRNFTLRHAVFDTFDDPIALNASDYCVSNPNLGTIEDGLIEDCYDLGVDYTDGFCIRILVGAWCDWFEGMEIQHSDAVIHNGKFYRAKMNPDGKTYISNNPPTHETGAAVVDGINWVRTQNDTPHTAQIRNIKIKDIYLRKRREYAFAIYMDRSEFLRSYYPNAETPIQSGVTFENIHVQTHLDHFLWVNAPLNDLTLKNCECKDIKFEKLDTEGLIYPEVRLKLENSAPDINNVHGTEIKLL